MLESFRSFTDAWQVFMLFLVPIGGGIPAGVVLANSRGITWPAMIALYFISDVVLAFLFEPVILMFSLAGKRYQPVGRFLAAFKLAVTKTTAHYGLNPSPLKLIFISFGVDPMTGRAAARFAGHGFVMGWLLAIIGDLFFFSVIMISTLWLNNILGDGTWTAVIVMALMFLVPVAIRRLRRHQGTIIKKSANRVMPWKNHKGTTAEIDREPAQGDYHWRLSRATISEDSEFSLFPGFDRLLVITEGAGVFLHDFKLEPLVPLRFRGEDQIACRLIAGEVIDLGLIFDREKIHAEMIVFSGPCPQPKNHPHTHYIYDLDSGDTYKNTPLAHSAVKRGVLVSIYTK